MSVHRDIALTTLVRELVAHAVHRQHVARIPGIGFELAPHVLDVRVDRAVERLHLHASNRVEQLRAGEDPPGLARERREQLELGRGEIDRLPARMMSPRSGAASMRRKTARTRATSSFGLNGLVT